MTDSTTRLGKGDELSSSQIVFAGGLAGLVSRFIISPLDVVKIRLQLQAYPHHRPTSANPPPQGLYRGSFHAFKRIVHDEGVTALWKGNISAEYLYLAYGSIQFVAYQQVSSWLSASNFYPSAIPLISGASAGLVSTSATYPFDLLRTRFAAQGNKKVYSSLTSSVKRIYTHEGPSAFFKGLGASLSQIVPQMGLFFAIYSSVQPVIATQLWTDSPLSFLGAPDAVAGAFASVCAKSAVYPLDTVRKRLQIQGPDQARYVHGTGTPQYHVRGPSAMLFAMVQREGFRSLYRGLGIALVKAAPSSAVTIWTYERAIRIMQAWRDRSALYA